MSNERQNKPSASYMERHQLCPGSWNAEQAVAQNEVEEETSADAEMGNRIHAVLAGETVTPPLTDDEERTMEACRSQAQALLDTITPHRDEMHLERRYWWWEDWSGKPDVVAVDSLMAEGLVIDYKTGRGDVASADGNMQLRALAVLVAEEYKLDCVTVAIVQPLAGPPSVCLYSAGDLKVARKEIAGIIDAIHKPNAPRIPSPKACHYCKAKGTERCPESIAAVESLPMEVSRDGREIVLTPERISELLEKLPMVEKVIEAIRGKARRMLEAGETVHGYTLKPGAERETITDPTTVYNRAAAAGVNSEAFMACVSVTKGKLKDAVKLATGEKGKALDARMETILAGCTETKAAAPSLAKIKEVA